MLQIKRQILVKHHLKDFFLLPARLSSAWDKNQFSNQFFMLLSVFLWDIRDFNAFMFCVFRLNYCT